MSSNRLVSVAPLATVMACVGLAVTDVVFSPLTPDYDALSETNSQMMSPGARFSPVMRLALVLYALLMAPFAIALARSVPRHDGTRRQVSLVLGVGGMWAHIFAAMLTALALNDSDELLAAGYTANDVHDMSAIAMFAAGLAVVVGVSIGYRPDMVRLKRFAHIVAAMMVLTGAIFLLRLWPGYDGIFERVLAVSFLLWMVVVAIAMHRTAQQPGPAETEAEALAATSL